MQEQKEKHCTVEVEGIYKVVCIEVCLFTVVQHFQKQGKEREGNKKHLGKGVEKVVDLLGDHELSIVTVFFL